MKRIYYFMAWHVRRLKPWQWYYLVAAFLFGASWSAHDPYRDWLLGISAFMFISWFLHSFVWSSIRDSWQEFNAEQDRLIDILKDTKDQSSVPK